MSVALHGNLKDFGLAEVFQLVGQQRKTGVLEIRSGGTTMRLCFAEGAVVSASPDAPGEHAAFGDLLVRCGLLPREEVAEALKESRRSARSLVAVLTDSGRVRSADIEEIEDLLTHESVFQVLRWSRGSFHFDSQPVSHGRPPEKLLGAEQILMDGLRMVDEWQTFAAQVPSGDTVFRRAAPFSVYRQQARGEAQARAAKAERVHQHVDGRLSARRVIDLSRLGTFEGTRALAELRQAGVIEVAAPGEVRRLRRREGGERPRGRGVLAALVAVLPLALLAGLAQLAARPVPGLPELPVHDLQRADGIAVPRDPLEASRRSYGRLLLRNALEAHRFLHGRYPDSLAELSGDDGAVSEALAAESARSYYYQVGNREVVLLPPER